MYILQSNMARYNQNMVPATCKLCGQEDETREHLLINCIAYADIRRKGLNKLQAILKDDMFTSITQDKDLLIQIILDCTHSSLSHLNLLRAQEIDIERWSQIYCEQIITLRANQL